MRIFYFATKGPSLTRVDIRNQLDLIKKYGLVITEVIILDDLSRGINRTENSDLQNVIRFTNYPITEESHDKLSLIRGADVVIVDISTQSTEIGICLSTAVTLNKPTLCLSLDTVYDTPNMNFESKTHVQDKYKDLSDFEMKLKLFLYKNNESPKIVVLGKVNVGKSLISSSLSRKFGMIHVNLDKIIREIACNKNHPLHYIISEHIAAISNIPDTLLRDIIMDKITQPDCISKGFVLDGYPSTIKDLHNFKKFYVVPTIVFHLDTNETNETIKTMVCSELDQSYFSSSLNVKLLSRGDEIANTIELVNNIVERFVYWNQQRLDHICSYHLITPPPTNVAPSPLAGYTKFNFTDRDHMMHILHKLLIKRPDLQSSIKLHPFSQNSVAWEEFGTIEHDNMDSVFNDFSEIIELHNKSTSRIEVKYIQPIEKILLDTESKYINLNNITTDVDYKIHDQNPGNIMSIYDFELSKQTYSDIPIEPSELMIKCCEYDIGIDNWILVKDLHYWKYCGTAKLYQNTFFNSDLFVQFYYETYLLQTILKNNGILTKIYGTCNIIKN